MIQIFQGHREFDVIALETDIKLLGDHADERQTDQRRPAVQLMEGGGGSDLTGGGVVELFCAERHEFF
ncbi:hypothetical protein [Prevotella sp. ne3005]|uniref:hypothetical protein n=1 Tax=Prevotella sp. ne3005 TaxID=1761887 RepID=UPI0039830A96